MAIDKGMREHAQALIRLGMTPEDSATAVHLAWLIRGLDGHTFPDAPAVVECLPRAHPVGYVAGYDGTSRNPERYIVHVEGIHQRFRESCLNTRFVRGYGPGTKFPSLLERITAVAVHEVRHRVQRLRGGKLRRWKPTTKATGLLAQVIRRAREEEYARQLAPLQAKVQSRRMYEARLREFDALVVEYAALHRLQSVQRPEDLVPLVLLEP